VLANEEIVPKKIVVFNPDEQYLHDGMFANETATLTTLHNWIQLSAGAFPSLFLHLPVSVLPVL
jgi:hypothetical protein